jgi:zinc transport system ATP-binding protein
MLKPNPIFQTGVLLAAEGLSVRLDGHLILDCVDFSIEAGQVVSLIGPNGAGKTTLVRALLGLTPASAKFIFRRAELRVGYVPQRVRIDPIMPLVVRRFLGLALPKKANGSPDRLIEAALEEVGAADLLQTPVSALSGGELQRVLIARALLRRPELLVLDEPAQGVDVTGQLEIYGLINAIRRQRGVAALLISHDLHLVMAATDQVICLNRHVCCAGQPEAVERHPEYVALFGEKGARALAVYTHHHDHAHASHGEIRPLNPNEGNPTG